MGNGSVSQQAVEQGSDSLAHPGLYLTFRLAGESYGLEILKVQEIIGIMKVTHIPQLPHYVRGIVNLRGKVIPVIDLRLKFGLQAQEDTERTCIIVVQLSGEHQQSIVGIIVDEVSEVLDIAESQIEAPPDFGSGAEVDFILGIGKLESLVIMLLDADRVFSGGGFNGIASLAAEEKETDRRDESANSKESIECSKT